MCATLTSLWDGTVGSLQRVCIFPNVYETYLLNLHHFVGKVVHVINIYKYDQENQLQ